MEDIMGIDCEKLLNKIDDSISEDVLFKKYSKEELLIGLINFYYPDQKYLNDKMEAFINNRINISDFRIIIKFIYKYAKNNEVNKELKDVSYYEIKEFNEFIHNNYVYVRNFLARCIVKERKIEYDSKPQYLAILIFRSKETNFALDDLVTFYKIVTKLHESLIKELIHAITYNEEFQNDKFTLFQPLFFINGRYYIPTLVIIFFLLSFKNIKYFI